MEKQMSGKKNQILSNINIYCIFQIATVTGPDQRVLYVTLMEDSVYVRLM